MSSRFFCAYHMERMKQCESEAYRNWSHMMHRGVKAYVDCRVEAARIYLGSALDIAMLRDQCENNRAFTETQIIKPVEFLVELAIAQDQFDAGIQLLTAITKSNSSALLDSGSFQDALAKLFTRIEAAEKTFFGEPSARADQYLKRHSTLANVH